MDKYDFARKHGVDPGDIEVKGEKRMKARYPIGDGAYRKIREEWKEVTTFNVRSSEYDRIWGTECGQMGIDDNQLIFFFFQAEDGIRDRNINDPNALQEIVSDHAKGQLKRHFTDLILTKLPDPWRHDV